MKSRFFILCYGLSLLIPPAQRCSEITENIHGIEIGIKKAVEFHIQKAEFAGIYMSVLFEEGYQPSCQTRGIYTDERPYCVFTFKKYDSLQELKDWGMEYLTKKNADMQKLSQVHLKVFYQVFVDGLREGNNEVRTNPFVMELWSEYNYFPDGKESGVGLPEKLLAPFLKNVWVKASAGFAYYDTAYPKKAKRVIGSLDTGVFFVLESQIKYQFLLVEILQDK